MFKNTAYQNNAVDIAEAVTFERNIQAASGFSIKPSTFERDIFAISGFCKLTLKVRLRLWHPGTLDRFVQAVVYTLINRESDAPVDLDLNIHAVELDSHIDYQGEDIFDPSRRWPLVGHQLLEDAVSAGWLRAHARETALYARTELATKAPHVTLRTNIERDGYMVLVK